MRLVERTSFYVLRSWQSIMLILLVLYLLQEFIVSIVSSYQLVVKANCTKGLMFLVFQVIIAAILLESFSSCSDKALVLPVCKEAVGIEEAKGNEEGDDYGDEDGEIGHHLDDYSKNVVGEDDCLGCYKTDLLKNVVGQDDCLDHYEADDENGSRFECVDDEDLERRIEEFIARSHRRWKEELLEEKLNLIAEAIPTQGTLLLEIPDSKIMAGII